MAVSALWRYVHPEAVAIAGAEWGAISRPPLGDTLHRKLSETPLGVYVEGAESVLASSPGYLADRAGGAPPYVAAIHGRLQVDKLRAGALYSQPADGAELLIAPGCLVALVNDETALVGDLESVKAALAGNPAPPSPLAERAAKIAQHADAWLLTAVSPAWFLNSGDAWADAAVGVDRLEAAAAIRDGLIFELHLMMPDSEAAASLASSAAGVASLAVLNAGGESAWAEVLERLTVFAEGSKVRVELSLTAGQFVQAVERLLAFGVQTALSPHLAGGAVPCRRLVEEMAGAFDTSQPVAENGVVTP